MSPSQLNNPSDEWLECCGCHRRYRKSDYKVDRLACPACGRELVALVHIEEKDVEQVLRGYFFPANKRVDDKCTVPAMLAIVLVCVLYLRFVRFSRPMLIFTCFWGLGCVFFSISLLQRWMLFRSFKRNRSNLEVAFARHREFMKEHEDWILDDEFGKKLEKNLRVRLSAAASVRTSYAAHHAESTSAFPAAGEGGAAGRVVARRRLPPDECPVCHAPYRIADYSGRRVCCRKCGSLVEIENAVEDAEISRLTEEYRKRLVKEDAGDNWCMLVLCCLSVLLTRYLWQRSDSMETFLCSWSVLSLYFNVMIVFGHLLVVSQRRKRNRLLKKTDFRLFDLEYFVRTEMGEDYDELRELDRFKGRLLALYKARGADRGEAMKGKVLT